MRKPNLDRIGRAVAPVAAAIALVGAVMGVSPAFAGVGELIPPGNSGDIIPITDAA